jgi:hypothetical protein
MLYNRAAARCRRLELSSVQARAQERKPAWASLAMPAEMGRLSPACPAGVRHDHRAAISAGTFPLFVVWEGRVMTCFTSKVFKWQSTALLNGGM